MIRFTTPLRSWIPPHRSGGPPVRRSSDGRAIGPLGTAARIALGALLFGSVCYGHLVRGPFRPLPWLLGLVVFPAAVTIWQYLRTRRTPTRLRADGPIATVLNIAIFLVCYFTYRYAPALGFLSDTALLYYGVSMLAAALRGCGGCESLAISNWLLRRDDQIGCLVFLPIDYAEGTAARGSRSPHDEEIPSPGRSAVKVDRR